MLSFIYGVTTTAILVAVFLAIWRDDCESEAEPPEYDSVRDRFERECG